MATRLQLLDDARYALVRRRFERKHRVGPVQTGKLGAIGVESLVVEFDELFCDLISLRPSRFGESSRILAMPSKSVPANSLASSHRS
jgi:hypothetical protein